MKENSKIYSPYEAFYIESMLFNTHMALDTLDKVNPLIEKATFSKSANEILTLLQDIALHGAALSRYFWPANKSSVHMQRANQLRQAFEVNDDSPLKDRGLRNSIEHFDEKLDRYLQAMAIVGNIVPQYVGPAITNDVPHHFFRAYYTDSGVFHVLNEKYELQPIINEIGRIHDLLLTFLTNGGRLS